MKLVKSLLLGSAAALVAGSAAQAADLPFKKAAPVEYVRVCDWSGAGFFYIPGTDTCLKIGGFARGDFELVDTGRAFTQSTLGVPGAGNLIRGRARDVMGYLTHGRLEADARTQTAYGTLRTFVRYQINNTSGNQNGGVTSGASNSATLDKGFIQFAGITAGRVQSFFDFGADPYGFEGVSTSDAGVNAFAYTYTAAGGFSVTGSVEDPNNGRRTGIGDSISRDGLFQTASYSGTRIPDLIGNVRVDQAWGAAQLTGAYHQITTISPLVGKDEDGFAVRGAVLFKLPFLAAGDEFQVEGGYENGAYSYQNSNGIFGGYGAPIVTGGYISHAGVDAVAVANPGGNSYSLSKSEGYSVSGGFVHFLTPNINDIVFGSYDHVEYGKGVGNLAYYNGGIGRTESYRIADQINWFPVKGLQIGLEVMYIKVDQKVTGILPTGVRKDPDAFEGHLRLERDF